MKRKQHNELNMRKKRRYILHSYSEKINVYTENHTFQTNWFILFQRHCSCFRQHKGHNYVSILFNLLLT